ncbi:hypothetical protein LBMAG42_47680 [Deltaproteobacteria bacterium]|nr:hypothetical protein LBMAG42_47680 [Deltaproteobacteria bacterium]
MVVLLALLVVGPAHAGAKTSAFQAENKKGTNYWNGGSAIDGKPETAWSVPGESANKGEWIELDIPKGNVEKIGVVAGWDKDEDSFKDYPRVKKLRVEVYSIDNSQESQLVGSESIEVADKRGLQIIPLAKKAVVGTDSFFGGKVKLIIEDVYDGDDYPNLRVSELAVYMGEMDAMPAATVEGGDLAPALDNSPKTVWVGAPGALITVDPKGWGVSSIGFQGDKAKGRAKTVKVQVGERPEETFTLADKPDLQWISLMPNGGYVGSTIDNVKLTLVDSYGADIGLQELKFKATAFEPL